MKKKVGGGPVMGRGVRADVNEELWGPGDSSESIIGKGSRLLSAYQIFTKYYTHYSLSVNIGFKSLAVILVEISHLQNFNVNFKIIIGQ